MNLEKKLRRKQPVGRRQLITTASPIIRKLMEEFDKSGLSYEELVQAAGVSRAVPTAWRKGRNVGSVFNVEAVGEVLGLELVWRNKETKRCLD